VEGAKKKKKSDYLEMRPWHTHTHKRTRTLPHKVKRPRNNDDVDVDVDAAARKSMRPLFRRARKRAKESSDEVKHTNKVKQNKRTYFFVLSLASHLIITFLFVNFAGQEGTKMLKN